MNSYANIDSMFASVIQDLLLIEPDSSRNGAAREVFGWSGRLLNPRANVLLNPARKLKAYYAAAELLWYLSRQNDIEMIKAYAPSYEKYADDEGKAFGAYGSRWANNIYYDEEVGVFLDQIELVTELLNTKPDTRQAVVSMWKSSDLYFANGLMPKKDIPCTVCMQFKIQKDKLHLAVYMRSNDAWLGLPYDVFCFTSIQQLIADELKLNVGEYIHNVGSMHLYERNVEKAKAVESSFYLADLGVEFENGYACHNNLEMAVTAALEYEELARNRKPDSTEKLTMGMGKGTLLRDCVAACWGKTLNYDPTGLMDCSPLERLQRLNQGE